MSFIKYYKINLEVLSPVHGVVKLIAKNFGSTDNDRGLRILFAIAGENANVFFAKFMTEFRILGIRECFQRRGIPDTFSLGQQLFHSLKSNPSLTRACSGGDQHVSMLQFLDSS